MTYPNVYAAQTGPLALSGLDANFLYAVDIANGALSATAGGTADAITATYSPAPAALVAGLTLYVRAASANATTTPQFSPNGLTGKIIVKNNNQALAVGDIAGAGHWLQLVYDATNGVWELMNPATFVGAVQTGGTANGVAYLNASKVLTTGTALTFDGTNFATTGTATATKLIPTGTSVTGNGLYLPAANSLGLSTNGTNAVYIDSSQNVGIGTSSPTALLTAGSLSDGTPATYGGTVKVASATQTSINSVGGIELNVATGYSTKIQQISSGGANLTFCGRQSSATWSEYMRIDASGNVGIGTASPSAKLTVTDSAHSCQIFIGYTDNNNYYQSNGAQIWTTYNGGAERMRIDSSGNLLVGTTTVYSSAKVTINSATAANPALSAFKTVTGDTSNPAIVVSKFDNVSTTSQVLMQFLYNNGSSGCGQINAAGAGNAAFGTYSDIRLKENITDLPSQLANICALRPVEFDYIESEGGGHQLGFIAQEVKEIYPDLVGEREDGMYTLSDMNKNDARLIKCIQEQQALITALTARITALEAK